MSGRLNLLDTMEQTMYKFSNGNPGALQTLFELLKANQENFFSNLLTIDRMEIYEDKLYMLWNDCCNRNIAKVQKILQLYRIGKINQQIIDERIKNVGYGKDFDDFLENKDNGANIEIEEVEENEKMS